MTKKRMVSTRMAPPLRRISGSGETGELIIDATGTGNPGTPVFRHAISVLTPV